VSLLILALGFWTLDPGISLFGSFVFVVVTGFRIVVSLMSSLSPRLPRVDSSSPCVSSLSSLHPSSTFRTSLSPLSLPSASVPVSVLCSERHRGLIAGGHLRVGNGVVFGAVGHC
jgi:hypothetical protein